MKALLLAALVSIAVAAAAESAPAEHQQARLVAWSVLPSATIRAGSPPSGAFLSATDRAMASANGVKGPETGAYFAAQPVQGFSSLVPASSGTWWALSDNGYAWRDNSADWQLAIYRVDPRWQSREGPALLESLVLHDPDRRVPWTIVCDPELGAALPPFSFNRMPPPPPACGSDPRARLLTGFDFDPESFVRAPDGSFWIGEEFGPFLLHVAADGRLLEAPFPVPGVRSPQNPLLDLSDRARPEAPTLAASRGFEGLAISPDGGTLRGLLEGAVSGDDPQDLRLYAFDVAARRFADRFLRMRLEAPAQTVNLAALVDAAGARVYPAAVAPPAGPVAIGEIKAVDDRRYLVVERDNLGDDEREPRFKKIFLVDVEGAEGRDGYVTKSLVADLLAIPDPGHVGGAADFFRLPFYTIESVHVVDSATILVGSDNNYPTSSGRARAASADRKGPLAADSSEMILLRLGVPLPADPRLFPRP